VTRGSFGSSLSAGDSAGRAGVSAFGGASADDKVEMPDWGNQSPEGYTWHHGACTDSGSCTMQLLPGDIHDGFSHQGAVSIGNSG